MANLLATCATKLTINGTTTAPEHLMVCGSARFVNSSAHDIYMGTSHGSVDISLQRAGSQDFKIRTYSGGWNEALRISGTGVFACSYLQSPTLCATTCTITHSLRQTTGQNYLCLYTGCDNNQPGGMKFMSCGGTLRGYVYFDGSSNFGLLNCSGQWALRIVGNHSSNTCMYTCHPLEAATSFKSPIVCGTTCVVGNRFKSNVRLWDTVAPSGNNFFAESGASGGDAFALGQGTGILDIWVKDDSVNELRSVFRANNQGNCIVIGRGCSANDNANIPVYVCNCLQSPILCATSCTNYGSCATSKIASDGDNMKHTTQYGFISLGPGNSSYAHFTTDRAQFYFNKKLVVNSGQLESYDENLVLQRTSSGTARFVIADGVTTSCQKMSVCTCIQSPILCTTTRADINCICATSGMSRSFPTWSTVGTRYLPQVNASANLPVGWYTIFVNTGNRAGGRFILRDTTGSRHQYVVFYASHSYGNGNSINVLQYSRYSGQPIQCIRVKDFSTYDGAALQVYVCDATNNLVAYEAGDNVHANGWYYLNSWCCDACVPYSYSCFNACWPAGCYCDGASVNLHCIQDGGQILTGKLYAPVLCATNCVQSNHIQTCCCVCFTQHNMALHAVNAQTMSLCSNHSGISSLRFDSNSGVQGYVYADAQHIGFLDADAHWMYYAKCDTCHNWRINNATKMVLYDACLCHCAKIEAATLCAPTCVSAAVVCSTGIVRGTAGCFVSSADSCFSGMIKTCCNLIVGAGGANRTLSVRHIDGKCHTNDNVADLFLQYSSGFPVYIGNSNSANTHLYLYGSLCACPANYNPACFKTQVGAGDWTSSCQGSTIWHTNHNYWYKLTNCGKSGYWICSDVCANQYWRVRNTSGDMVTGMILGCAGDFCACICAKSPIVCGTSCLTTDGCLKFTQNTPYICTGGAYVIMPSGLYLSGGTFYAENTTMHRNGICDDTASTLDIWGGTGSNITLRGNTFACVCLCVNCTLCMAPDSSGDMNNGITLGKVGGLPQAVWGESGSKTGRIEIGLPTRDGEGGTVHHGMVHVAIDVYEYNSNDATTIIVGGHNWNCRWYNCGAHITGGCTDKTIKLAYHSCGGTNNGRYVILLGECDSTWTYGSVHVRSITNGLYYCDNMNMGTPWYLKRVTCADSHYNLTSADLRSSSNSMAGYQCATVCFHGPRVCATTCLDTSVVCGSSVIKSADWVCAARICSTACILTPTCVHGATICGTGCAVVGTCLVAGTAICAVTHGSIHTAGNLCCGLAVGQAYSNEGGWHNQLNTYGANHNIIRIKKNAGDTADNAQCLSLWVHNSHAATIQSTGNLLLKAGSAMSMCLKSGLACTPILCAPTCVKSACICASSNMLFEGTLYAVGGAGGHWDTNRLCAATCVVTPVVFPSGCLQFDQSGTRSWKVCASGGNLNFHSGDGSGVHYFHTHLYATYLHSTTYVWGASCLCSPVVCGTSCVQTHYYRSGANNMCLCPSGCGYGLFLGNSVNGEKQHWTTAMFTASGTQARRAKLLEFSYNTHHWDSGGPIIIEIFRNYYGKGSSQKWQIVHTGLDGTGSQNCSAGADLPAGARDVALMLLESSGPDTNQFKLHVDMHAAGFKISDYDVGIAEVYLDIDYYAQVAAKVTLNGTWYNINTGASFTTANSSQYKFYDSPSISGYTNISTFHNAAPTVPSTGGRILFADKIYGKAYWQACCQNCYTNVCTRYLDFHGTSCLTNLNTQSTICGSGLICANSCLHSPIMCFSTCLCATAGCIKVPIMEVRYCNANTNHRGGMCWSHVQLGNNGVNRIISGATAAGGYLDIHSNNTADVLGGTTTNGTHNARFWTNSSSPETCLYGTTKTPAIYAGSFVNSPKFCSGSTYLCNGCLSTGNITTSGTLTTTDTITSANKVCASNGFYGDGSNLSGISAGIDGCSFQGAVGTPSDCNYERTTNVRLGTCALATGKGIHSTAIGNNALQYQNCSWSGGFRSANTAIGADAQRCSMGFQNTSVGWMAMRGAANNCKCYNIGIGACTGYLGILGNYAVAIGTGADRYMSDCSVSIGGQSDAGNEAVMVGFSSGANDGTFKGDVAMGYRSLYSSGCGCYRIAIGHNAGYSQGQWNHKEKYTIAIGACALACGSHYHDCFNYNIVIGNPHNSCAAGQCLGSCTCGCMIVGDGNISNACICAACTHVSALSKSSGSFRIKHPNPSCSNNRTLYHSFVESPNEGDNIYRWQVETSDCTSVITLPNYYRYLNKNDMVWVSPYRHFGSAYGEVTTDQCCLIICSNSDGCFNVLLVGTRKDSAVSQSWKGVERDEEWTEPCYG